jgi:hypothetical protein
VAQTVLLSPVHRRGNWIGAIIGTTTLYSNCTTKDSVSRPPSESLCKVFCRMGICLYLIRQSIQLKILQSGDVGSERLGRSVALERRNCQGRDFAQPDRKGKDKATADFSTAAAKCAAFGRNDDLGVRTLINKTLINKNAMGNYS